MSLNTSVSNITWHEVGHVIYQGKTQDKVLKFDNLTRQLNKSTINLQHTGYYKTGVYKWTEKRFYSSPLSPRTPDITHNRLVK